MKTLLTAILLCLGVSSLAQNIAPAAFGYDFAAQVKSVDEFICRFNGTETKPGIAKDGQWKRNSLLSLFDIRMSHGGLSDEGFMQLLTAFIDSCIENDAKLELTDAEMWAEINTSATIDGKKKNIDLLLRSETYKDSLVRWAIVDVKGLARTGVIDTARYYAISPVEHELHFMAIGDIFQNCRPEIMGYRGKGIPIDELSVFFAFAMSGKVKIDMVDRLTMHCLEVPGFVFTVNEQGRSGHNSGWLISSLAPLKESEKQQYIKNILEK